MKLLKITKAFAILLSMVLAWLFSKLIAAVLIYLDMEAATADDPPHYIDPQYDGWEYGYGTWFYKD